MRVSYFGIALASVYIQLSILSVAYGISTGDSKGSFVLFQLPLALQIALIDELGLRGFLQHLSWYGAYLFIGLPTIFFLYLFGYLFGLAFETIRKRILK